jgi:hypothetical protein
MRATNWAKCPACRGLGNVDLPWTPVEYAIRLAGRAKRNRSRGLIACRLRPEPLPSRTHLAVCRCCHERGEIIIHAAFVVVLP